MRSIVLIASILAVAAVSSAGAVSTPSLRVMTKNPLVVRGTNFHSHELVTVTSGSARAIVRTTVAGVFRANLGAAIADRCSYRIVASGARGDRAVLAARIECAPASTP